MNTKIYHSLYTLFVAGALLASGCSNDDDTYDFYAAHPDAVRFNITVDGTPQTRVNTEGDGTTFDPGNRIAISADGGTSYSTYRLGNDWLPTEGQRYLRWKEETLSFQAYYPVTEGTDYTHFTVPTNQSGLFFLQAADYMKAEAADQSSANPVKLTFKHQLAKVIITSITLGEEVKDKTIDQVTFHTKGHALENGRITNGDEDVRYYSYCVGNSYMAILPPQSGNSSAAFIKVVLNNYRAYPLTGIPALEPGKAYTLALRVGHDGVKLVRDIIVEDWGNEVDMPGGTATLKPEYYSWYTTNPNAETFTLSTADELRAFAKLVNGDPEALTATTAAGPVNFEGKTVQIADDVTTLDLSGTQWTPIGTSQEVSFKGIFDGKGKDIKGLTITASSGENFGLFGVMNGDAALVRNVRLTRVDIECPNSVFVGGIVGRIYIGSVSSCYVSGTIAGKNSIGGITGIFNSKNHSITDCYTTGTITGLQEGQSIIGGIVGENSGQVENCYSTANVTTTGNAVGGIVGINRGGFINHCYSTGTISGTYKTGGIAGTCWNNPKITGCIALNAEVKANDTEETRFGRISGTLEFSDPITGIIENCHAFEGMKVYKGSELQTIDDGAASNVNGANLTATACLTASTYTGAGWSTENWVFDGNTPMQSLPWLKVFDTWTWENVADYRPAVPAHLVQVP